MRFARVDRAGADESAERERPKRRSRTGNREPRALTARLRLFDETPCMDLLDRLLGHDAWTTRQLLLCCRSLTDGQLDQDLEIAHRTVRATFLHIIRNLEVWSDLMSGAPVRTDTGKAAGGRSVAGMIERLDRAAADFSAIARGIAGRGAWDERWVDVLEHPPAEKTYGGAIAHVITHSMHHRAQLLDMLRRLGIEGLPEGDVLSWEQQAGSA